MNKHILRILIILAALAAVPLGVALAHGTPVIAIQPDVVAAGGQITVTGTEMEAGEIFTITLDGTAGSITLGTVTAKASSPSEASMSADSQMKATPEAELKATAESEMAAADSEAVEGGFSAAFAIPKDTVPGSYIIKAVPEDGDATTADLTVTEPSEQASSQPATIQEPTGEEHQLDRSKPTSQIIGVVVVAVVSGGLGLWLARKQ